MKKNLVAVLAILLIVVFSTPLDARQQNPAPHHVTLNWKAPVVAQGSAPPRYNIYRSEDGGRSFARIAKDVSETTYNDANVQGGKTYRYTVTSVDAQGRESVRASGVEATVPK